MEKLQSWKRSDGVKFRIYALSLQIISRIVRVNLLIASAL